MTKYKILKSTQIESLENEVNDYLEQGYMLIGGVSSVSYVYNGSIIINVYQAVCLPSDVKKD